jgi:hypothetical protein
MNIPDAPATLVPLLRRLFYEADTGISQHAHTPQPDVWYAGHGRYGDFGPYASAEDAVVGLVVNLWERLDEVRQERDLLEMMRDTLRAELRAAHNELQRVGTELVWRGGGGGGTPPTAPSEDRPARGDDTRS